MGHRPGHPPSTDPVGPGTHPSAVARARSVTTVVPVLWARRRPRAATRRGSRSAPRPSARQRGNAVEAGPGSPGLGWSAAPPTRCPQTDMPSWHEDASSAYTSRRTHTDPATCRPPAARPVPGTPGRHDPIGWPSHASDDLRPGQGTRAVGRGRVGLPEAGQDGEGPGSARQGGAGRARGPAERGQARGVGQGVRQAPRTGQKPEGEGWIGRGGRMVSPGRSGVPGAPRAGPPRC